MKHSIKQIFNNLTMLWILIVFVITLLTLITIERNISFLKVNLLNTQKQTLLQLIEIDKNDLGSALIQYNGKTAKMLNEIDKLRHLYIYDFTGHYILENSNEYMSDLDKLAKLTIIFDEQATNYYIEDEKDVKTKLQNLKESFYNLNKYIDSIIFKNISYEETKFYMFERILILAFFIILFTTIWYRKRLNSIYKDILFLFAINTDKNSHDIFSQELDVISQKMKRKENLNNNKSMVDATTDIYNSKGLFSSYTQKKNLQGENLTFITLLEIDNFTHDTQTYTKKLENTILKKIAFTISLYEQPSDVIARTAYNQFTIISSRPSKEKAFKEVDAIRQNISEIKLIDDENINLSISGGFIIKNDNSSLEEASKDAKKVLAYAKNSGKNKIAQKSDLIKI